MCKINNTNIYDPIKYQAKRRLFKKLTCLFLRLRYKSQCTTYHWYRRFSENLFSVSKIGGQAYIYIGKGMLLKTDKSFNL
jgi:hypothetical protein